MNSTQHQLSPMLVALISVASELAVTCNCYAQPLLGTNARSYHLSVNQAGFIVTTAQLCRQTAAAALNDRSDRRGLSIAMSLQAADGMMLTALSTQQSMLLSIAQTDLFSVVAQVLASLIATQKRGNVADIAMSSSLPGLSCSLG